MAKNNLLILRGYHTDVKLLGGARPISSSVFHVLDTKGENERTFGIFSTTTQMYKGSETTGDHYPTLSSSVSLLRNVWLFSFIYPSEPPALLPTTPSGDLGDLFGRATFGVGISFRLLLFVLITKKIDSTLKQTDGRRMVAGFGDVWLCVKIIMLTGRLIIVWSDLEQTTSYSIYRCQNC